MASLTNPARWPFSVASSASSSAIRPSRDGKRLRHVGGLETLRDMLRAIQIPGRDRNRMTCSGRAL